MKKIFLYITIFLLTNSYLLTQEPIEEQKPIIEQEEKKEEKQEEQKEEIKEDAKEINTEEVKKDSVLFRDPIFGIDYTNKDLGNITDFDIINERDTLLYTRSYGDWWYGVSWLASNNTIFLGDFNFSKISYLPVGAGNPRVPYSNNQTNTMFNISFLTEWTPVRQVWGVGSYLRYERIYIDSDFEPQDAEFRNYIFNTNVELNFITLSPFFKYKTPLEGLNLLALVDMSYILNYNSYFFRQQKSGPSEIRNEYRIDFKDDIQFKFGINFGIEYEYLLQDIQKIEFFNKINLFRNTRVKIAPSAMIGINTSPITNNGGAYPVTFRAGLSFKLGPDKMKSDTIYYNPTPRYEYLAKFEPKVKVRFEGFLERESLSSADIAFYEVAQISNQISEEPKLPTQSLRETEDSQIASALKEPEKPKFEFKKGFKKTYLYATSESVRPSKELRDFLDELTEWMKKNPNAEIRVVGHSDFVGTGAEIQERSSQRAKMVQQYLVAKGINARRVLVTALGARDPVADIYSAAGRAKNRRVEIQVVG